MEYYSDFEDEEDFIEIDSKPSPSPPPFPTPLPLATKSAAEGKASIPPIDANPL